MKAQRDRRCAGKGRHLDGGHFISLDHPGYHDAQVRRVQTRGGAKQRGDGFGGDPVRDLDVEEGQLREGYLGEGGFDCAGRDAAEGELGEVPPEAAPPAGEDAGAGNGGGAAEAEPGGALKKCMVTGLRVNQESESRYREREASLEQN